MDVLSSRLGLRQFLFAASIFFGLLAVTPIRAQQPASTAKPGSSSQTLASGKLMLYAAVGPELTQFEVDSDTVALVKRGSVTLPGSIQYAWPHPSRQYLYVAWSNGELRQYGVTVLRIDPVSAALHPLGRPASLPSRPIHLTTDPAGTHVLVAYNNPSGVTVHQISPDGEIVSQINPPSPLDLGIYAHQVRVDPGGRSVVLVTRGNGPAGVRPEDPGALKIFDYEDGVLTNRMSIAPRGGRNFQPRHLDFHPTRAWAFVSLERQNKLQVYRQLKDGGLSAAPLFTKDSLAEPENVRPGQVAGTVHVHPNGKFVYQANRASDVTNFEGNSVFAGGENNIAVYAFNQDTGEPVLIQNIDTHGLHPRTFALDAGGRIVVVGNQMSLLAREGSRVTRIPANLAVYRVGGDGKLNFIRKYDVESGGGKTLMWVGLVALP